MNTPAGRILYGVQRPDGCTPYWRTPTIWAAAEGKPQVSVAIEHLKLLDDVVWFGGPKNVEPTVRRVADHARSILAADLTYPIIVTASGDVLDGAHRVARAYIEGQQSVSAVVLDDWPPPDGIIRPLPQRAGLPTADDEPRHHENIQP